MNQKGFESKIKLIKGTVTNLNEHYVINFHKRHFSVSVLYEVAQNLCMAIFEGCSHVFLSHSESLPQNIMIRYRNDSKKADGSSVKMQNIHLAVGS